MVQYFCTPDNENDMCASDMHIKRNKQGEKTRSTYGIYIE